MLEIGLEFKHVANLESKVFPLSDKNCSGQPCGDSNLLNAPKKVSKVISEIAIIWIVLVEKHTNIL